ncbi:MAG: c-type cytochrome [Thermogemmata sp.]|nr:c-type cytochrome [Thermogemmata sp.]
MDQAASVTPPPLIAPTEPLTPEAERQALMVPAGFVVQLVASEPQIDKPIQMAFDGQGRLWVTTSRHYPFPAEPGKAQDKVFVLSDFDPRTGRARSIQVFANDLNIPIGILPLPDGRSALISSCGEIRKYLDHDGDGRADTYQVLFRGFGFRDTHGRTNSFTLMPDGWVYACHGFANDSTVTGRDGGTVRMHSGHTFRFRPDGSRIEIFTSGQVNPFGMAVDPNDRLYTADCHSRPITQLIPHAYYESFGKPHDGLGFAPHVTRHDHGSTALCGLVWYQADHFPKDWQHHMFLGNVVTNRINCDRIVWNGSTPVGQECPDFLISRDPWFRPVDLKLGPDGALYVADFYNRIIGHYEVDLRHPGRDRERGRLWRIVWRGQNSAGVSPPQVPFRDLTSASLEELLRLSRHANLTVRLLARQHLATRFPEAWRRTEPPLDALHACRIIAQDNDPQHCRQAVDYLILHPTAQAIVPLLSLLHRISPQDTHLRHASRIALRNALRDTPDGWNTAREHLQEHPTGLPRLLDILPGIPGPAAATFLAHHWREGGLSPTALHKRFALSLDAYLQGVTLLAQHASLEILRPLGGMLEPSAQVEPVVTLRIAQTFYRNYAGRSLPDELLPPSLEDLLRTTLQQPTITDAHSLAVDVLTRARPLLPAGERRNRLDTWAAESVTALLLNSQAPLPLRQQLIHLAVRDYLNKAQNVLIRLLNEPQEPAALREHLLVTLAAHPAALQLSALQESFRRALHHCPYRVVQAVALQLATSKGGAELLLQMVQKQQLPPVVLRENAIRERLLAHRQPQLENRWKELTRDLPPFDQQLQQLIRQRATAFTRHVPDRAAGARLFVQHCAPCHRLGGQGATFAPQLDGIAQRGPERLLEDILDPNRNVDPAFRARIIVTTDERTLTGLLVRAEADQLVLIDSTGKEIRLSTREVASNRETPLSPMPTNFAQLLSEKELFDLLGYLLHAAAPTPPKH